MQTEASPRRKVSETDNGVSRGSSLRRAAGGGRASARRRARNCRRCGITRPGLLPRGRTCPRQFQTYFNIHISLLPPRDELLGGPPSASARALTFPALAYLFIFRSGRRPRSLFCTFPRRAPLCPARVRFGNYAAVIFARRGARK